MTLRHPCGSFPHSAGVDWHTAGGIRLAPVPCARGMSPAKDASGNPSRTPHRLPSGLLQGVLAAATLLSLGLGIHLGQRMSQLHAASVRTNQEWTRRLADYTSLRQLAADLGLPGNDIFQSRNVRPETRKFYTSRAVLRQALTTARREIVRTVPRAEAKLLLADLVAIRRALRAAGGRGPSHLPGVPRRRRRSGDAASGDENRRAASLRAVFGTFERHFDEVAERRIAAQARCRAAARGVRARIALLAPRWCRRDGDRLRRAWPTGRRTSGRATAPLGRGAGGERGAQGRHPRPRRSTAIITMDHAGLIREFNPAAERTSDTGATDVLGADRTPR